MLTVPVLLQTLSQAWNKVSWPHFMNMNGNGMEKGEKVFSFSPGESRALLLLVLVQEVKSSQI